VTGIAAPSRRLRLTFLADSRHALHGMAAASFTPSACRRTCLAAISISTLGTGGIAAVTFVVLGLALLTSWVDRRFAAQTLELQEEKLQRSEAYLAEAQRLTHTGSWAWRVAGGDAVHLSRGMVPNLWLRSRKWPARLLNNFCSALIRRIEPSGKGQSTEQSL